MSEKELLVKEKLEHSGIFDFSGLYGYLNSWFKDESYDLSEDNYSEKVSGGSRDITVEWTATKGLSDYFKIEHKFKFTISGLTDVEVEIDKEKRQMNKGKILVEIKSSIIMDPDGKWETSPFYRLMRETYNKYIIPTRVQGIKDKVSGDSRTIKGNLKSYLDLIGK